MTLWTPNETEYLKKHYPRQTGRKIATKLNRTLSSVQSKAWLLGLHKLRMWTEEEVRLLKENYNKMLTTELAIILNRPPCSIRHKAMKIRGFRRRPYKPKSRNSEVVNIPKLSEFDLGYLCGLIDGEGSIFFCKQSCDWRPQSVVYYPKLNVGGTNPAPIKWCKDTLHIGFVHRFKRGESEKDGWIWQIGRFDELVALLKLVKPHLKIKKKQAELVLKFIKIRYTREIGQRELYSDEELEAVKTVKALNRRGKKTSG